MTGFGTVQGLVLCLSVMAVLVVAGARHPAVANRWNCGAVVGALVALACVCVATSDVLVYDRDVYLNEFLRLAQAGTPWESDKFAGDPLFLAILWVLGRLIPHTEQALFGSIAVICAIGLIRAYARLIPGWAVLGAVMTVLGTGLFGAYTAVAVRQGLAIVCLLLATAYFVSGSGGTVPFVGWLLAASELHWTAGILAVALLVLRFAAPRLKLMTAIWLVCAVLYVTGGSHAIMDRLPIDTGALDRYSTAASIASYGASGPRLDFLAVSGVLLLVGLAAMRTVGRGDLRYERIVVTYLTFNLVFLLPGWVAYSDRLAAYSWFVAPLLLWYPVAVVAERRRSAVPLMAIGGVVTLGVLAGSLLTLAP